MWNISHIHVKTGSHHSTQHRSVLLFVTVEIYRRWWVWWPVGDCDGVQHTCVTVFERDWWSVRKCVVCQREEIKWQMNSWGLDTLFIEMKRDLKRIHVRVCRCNERLNPKTEGSTLLTYTRFSGGLGNLKIETRLSHSRGGVDEDHFRVQERKERGLSHTGSRKGYIGSGCLFIINQ
jgi:hypothetical protein